jgi:hypothetical protein
VKHRDAAKPPNKRDTDDNKYIGKTVKHNKKKLRFLNNIKNI